MMNKKNMNYNQTCYGRGMKAENEFVIAMEKTKNKCFKATSYEDINEHFDIYVISEGRKITFDIKAMKKKSREDKNIDEGIIWIELKGVKDEGWLYGGKADYIVFEKKLSFIAVEREKLINIVESKIDRNKIVEKAEEALYKIYSRKGRNDIITMIKMEDINEIIEWEIKK